MKKSATESASVGIDDSHSNDHVSREAKLLGCLGRQCACHTANRTNIIANALKV